ncbi:YciI family protein [Stenotrophomonas tumulicola]|uniref:YciI family protein n=1 Tax=Stenotrophomonas tumulicola TaxID=1685415 RepID=A0A7W3FP36_9GAMM|nr:YciI family protein [Stenotrophomonas tumulicola]MBA8683143.1 YciI family protein [Stenotrophomonas tumulicola]
MKVMVIVKSDARIETGALPCHAELESMGRFNEELVRAGVMLAGEGLHASRRGHRIRFNEQGREVIDGPFADPTTLVAGFWLWQVRSLDEALEWAQRAPFGPGAELELRQVMAEEDFGDAFTEELRGQEQRLRDALDAR